MKDKDIHRLIQEQNKEENDALFERIQSNLGFSSQAQAKPKHKFNYKIFTLATALVLVLCLAVVLPIVLQSDDGQLRYSATNMRSEELGYTLNEYIQNHGISVLYIDWEIIDESVTERYYDINNYDQTVYLSEFLVNGETGYSLKYIVMPLNISVDSVEFDESAYTDELIIRDVNVSYSLGLTALAKFEYQGYKYYFEFYDSVDEQFIRETIESMFN